VPARRSRAVYCADLTEDARRSDRPRPGAQIQAGCYGARWRQRQPSTGSPGWPAHPPSSGSPVTTSAAALAGSPACTGWRQQRSRRRCGDRQRPARPHWPRTRVGLHLSQPALSKQIRGLETTLRAQLLRRDRRQVELTAADTALHAVARSLLQEWDDGVTVVADAATQDAGVLRVRTLTSQAISGWPSTRASRASRVAAEVSSADEKLEIVSSGAAITLLAEGNADIYSCEGIVCIPVSGLEPAWLAIAWRRSDGRPAVQDFVQACREAADTQERNFRTGRSGHTGTARQPTGPRGSSTTWNPDPDRRVIPERPVLLRGRAAQKRLICTQPSTGRSNGQGAPNRRGGLPLITEWRSRIGGRRGHQASMEYAKLCISMRSCNARYSANECAGWSVPGWPLLGSGS
jgi:Bacterial regulatory helix-turn-helix protein, lysR family